MKPRIGDFKGQTCLFTCPVLDVYKYLTFSHSEEVLQCLRTLHFQERKSIQELLFNHSNQNTFASYFIFNLLCLHRIDPCMVLNHHISFGMSSLISYYFSVVHNWISLYFTCMLL